MKDLRIRIKTILKEEFENSTTVYRGIGDRINATYGKGSDDGMGVFWTDNLTMAKWFAGLIDYSVDTDRYENIKGSKGKILTKEIKFENPYVVDSDDEDNDSFQVYMDEIYDFGGVDKYKEMLIEKNYDGIILRNCSTNYYENGTYDIFIEL
jgi:hypothetical protein